MAVTSVVVVADDETSEGGGAPLVFTPGDVYPISGVRQLSVRNQPFPSTAPPTRVVPSIVEARFSFGHYDQANGTGQQPGQFKPEEHSFREVHFSADYVRGSWQVVGEEGHLKVSISGGLRDNTPSGDAEPDDPFIAYLRIQAICIWTLEFTVLDQLEKLAESIFTFKRP